jgi:hypothetical protein
MYKADYTRNYHEKQDQVHLYTSSVFQRLKGQMEEPNLAESNKPKMQNLLVSAAFEFIRIERILGFS